MIYINELFFLVIDYLDLKKNKEVLSLLLLAFIIPLYHILIVIYIF